MNGYFTELTVDPVGKLLIAKTTDGICRLVFGNRKGKFIASLPEDISWQEKKNAFSKEEKELKEYFSSHRKDFDFKTYFLEGTAFQKKVWKTIAKIPFAETRSYKWIAKTAGKPKAIRAAANACGVNPTPILIPCHRVIASDGSLGGFSSGLKIKKILLKTENFPLKS